MSPCAVWCVLIHRSPVDRLRSGGDDGIRTHDPLLAGQVLSQLSYTPVVFPFARSLEIEQQAKSDVSVLAYLSRILFFCS